MDEEANNSCIAIYNVAVPKKIHARKTSKES
jgi:hypothetical protein